MQLTCLPHLLENRWFWLDTSLQHSLIACWLLLMQLMIKTKQYVYIQYESMFLIPSSFCCFRSILTIKRPFLAMVECLQVIHIDPSNSDEMNFWEANNKKIAGMAKGSFSEDKVVGLLCQNFTCKPPVYDPASLQALLLKEI